MVSSTSSTAVRAVEKRDPALERREALPAGEGRRHHRFGWAGLALGAGAWAANTQANQALTPWACATGMRLPLFVSLGLAVVALAGVLVSAVVWGRAGGFARFRSPGDGRPGLFLAGLGVTAGIIFMLAILSQGSANLLLMGCER
jgi:hypothetical protein